MPKNAVKPEAAEPTNETASSNPRGQNDLAAYSEKTSLGGPIPIVMGTGPMACKLKLSSKILEASGLRANDRIEMIAGENEIVIRKVGTPGPGLPFKSTNGTTRMLDSLMEFTREREAELKEATARRYAPPEPEEEGEDEGGPLNLEQVSGEEL